VLAGHCTSWATFTVAAADVAARGILVPGRSSADTARQDDAGLVKNPSVQIMRDAQTQLRAWAKELGFTPAARGRIKHSPQSADSRSAERLLN